MDAFVSLLLAIVRLAILRLIFETLWPLLGASEEQVRRFKAFYQSPLKSRTRTHTCMPTSKQPAFSYLTTPPSPHHRRQSGGSTLEAADVVLDTTLDRLNRSQSLGASGGGDGGGQPQGKASRHRRKLEPIAGSVGGSGEWSAGYVALTLEEAATWTPESMPSLERARKSVARLQRMVEMLPEDEQGRAAKTCERIQRCLLEAQGQMDALVSEWVGIGVYCVTPPLPKTSNH